MRAKWRKKRVRRLKRKRRKTRARRYVFVFDHLFQAVADLHCLTASKLENSSISVFPQCRHILPIPVSLHHKSPPQATLPQRWLSTSPVDFYATLQSHNKHQLRSKMGAQCWVAAEGSRNWRKLVNSTWSVCRIT